MKFIFKNLIKSINILLYYNLIIILIYINIKFAYIVFYFQKNYKLRVLFSKICKKLFSIIFNIRK